MAKKKKGVRKTYGVVMKAFSKIWQSSKNLKEAAERLGMPPSIASSRAAKYRKRGIPLKFMPRTDRQANEVAETIKMLEQMKTV